MTLGDVHVNRDGTIRNNGEAIGFVMRNTVDTSFGHWRAEVGDPGKPDAWPAYQVRYANTRKRAVERVLAGIEDQP